MRAGRLARPDEQSLRAYYGNVAAKKLPGVDLAAPSAHIEAMQRDGPSRWTITLLTVGDEGSDPRCM